MKVKVSISTMALQNSQDFAASHALHLRDAVGVTEDDTNLGRGEPLFRQLAEMVLNLKVERNGWGSSEVSDVILPFDDYACVASARLLGKQLHRGAMGTKTAESNCSSQQIESCSNLTE